MTAMLRSFTMFISRRELTMKIFSFKTTSYCFVTVTVVQSVTFLIITITWSRIRSANNEPKASKLCTECKDLVPLYDNNGISSEVEKLRISPNSQCCGEMETILRFAVQKETNDMFFIRIRYMVTEAVYQMCDSYVDQTPYFQAVGIQGSKPIGGLYLLLWNQNGKTVTQPSIQHITHLQDEGEIFIRRAGLYTVSSRLAIQTNASTIDGTFSHFIYVLSHKYGTRRMLGERRATFWGRQQTFSTFKSVYNLDLHDRLSVVITNPEHIDTHNDDNVFSVCFAGSD